MAPVAVATDAPDAAAVTVLQQFLVKTLQP